MVLSLIAMHCMVMRGIVIYFMALGIIEMILSDWSHTGFGPCIAGTNVKFPEKKTKN